jgi:hypothetical protein
MEEGRSQQNGTQEARRRGDTLERATYSQATQEDGTRVGSMPRALDLSSMTGVTADMQVYLRDTVESGTAQDELAATEGQGVPAEYLRVQEPLAEP